MDEEQLAFLADPGIPNGKAVQTTIPNTASFQTEDLDAYDSDCDDVSNTKAVLMDNLSNYGSDVISEVPHFEPYHTDMDNQSVHAMQSFEQHLNIDLSTLISSQHVASPVIDDEETLILEKVSRSKMPAKQNNPMLKEKKVNTTPINYVELNRLSEDFGKRFVPEQELSNEQAFWLETSHPNTDQSASSPIKIEAPKLTMQLNQENFQMDSLSNNQNALEIPEYFENNHLKAQLQAKDTTICKLKEHIISMRENNKEKKVKHEMNEIETINIELENSQIQEKVFVTTAFKSELSRLKGKHMLDNATTIAPEMFQLDIEPLSHRLKNNKDAHEDYLKKTIVNADTIRGLVERARKPNPSEPLLDSMQVYKTRLKYSTSTCRSQPTGNKKNDRISQKPSSNRKNKVEAQPRKVNKKNRVKEPICDVNVKHTMLNANSQLIFVKCKQCMFDANHDVCFLDFVNDMNMRAKSKFKSKKNKQHSIWKPTEIKVYSKRPKQVKSVGSSKTSKIVESTIAINSEPTHLWGSNATDVPSSSLVNDRTELITPDLICPSTYQLLRNSSGDSRPDLSFDKSASLKRLFGLAHASLVAIEPTVTLFRVFHTLYKQGDWFSFTKRRAPSPVCIDDNRSCMKHWKSGFFLIDRRAIPNAMVWRHPHLTIDDPRPATSSFNMADVHRLSAHVIKLRDMPKGVLVLSGLSRVWKNRFCDPVIWGADGNVMGIHDFLYHPEWTDTKVQEYDLFGLLGHPLQRLPSLPARRCPYQFEMFIPNNSTVLKLQTVEDLQGDALLHYDAEMELMNLILLSIPNYIYNSVDACTSAKDMWKRVERLMRGTTQNKVDRETHFTNKFDQFVAEPGEAIISVYNHFA
ncbi:hypothetical protein Tco_0762441 [Tanacetum coccineum]